MLSIKVNKNIVKLKRIHIKNFITHNPLLWKKQEIKINE